MQPCDVGRFAPIKRHFCKHLQLTLDKRPGIQPHRSEYATLISNAAVETGTREAIQNSFKATGIWPIDETVYNKQLGPSLLFVDGDGSGDEEADGGLNENGSDEEEEELPSGDEDGEAEAENKGSRGAGTGYDAFTAPPFAESWEAWERDEERHEQQETVGATCFEDNDGFDPGEPPLEPVHPWEMGQPTLHVGSLTSALAEAVGESGSAIAGGGKEEAAGQDCN